jgi:type IV pilus assembly protein PilM
MSPLASWLATPPPDAAIEISPDAVSVAAIGSRGRDTIVQAHAIQPLPAGAVVATLTAHNLVDRPAVVQAVREALERASLRPRRVALVLPDVCARVSLIRFDRIPDRREDLDQLVRWQVRKAAPFPIEEASISYSGGARFADGGGEFVVVMARRDIVREYEGVCDELGLHAGLIDLATLSVLNLFLASAAPAPTDDWLLVHIRPEYVSVAIMRGHDMIFFRNRADADDEGLPDLVHQTSMYYQDRLSGRGFARVLVGGVGHPGTIERAQRNVEERLGVRVEPIDATRVAGLADRIDAGPLSAGLAPLVGILLRTRSEAAAA